MNSGTRLPACAYCGDPASAHPDGMHGSPTGACRDCDGMHVPGVSRWTPCTGYVHPDAAEAPEAPVDRSF